MKQPNLSDGGKFIGTSYGFFCLRRAKGGSVPLLSSRFRSSHHSLFITKEASENGAEIEVQRERSSVCVDPVMYLAIFEDDACIQIFSPVSTLSLSSSTYPNMQRELQKEEKKRVLPPAISIYILSAILFSIVCAIAILLPRFLRRQSASHTLNVASISSPLSASLAYKQILDM